MRACVCLRSVFWVGPGISLLIDVCRWRTAGVGAASQHLPHYLCWQPPEGRNCALLIPASLGGTEEVLGARYMEIKWS